MPYKDKDRERAYKKAYRQANLERMRALDRSWRRERREYYREYMRSWHAAHPDYNRAYFEVGGVRYNPSDPLYPTAFLIKQLRDTLKEKRASND
jgi:hypothetical protein